MLGIGIVYWLYVIFIIYFISNVNDVEIYDKEISVDLGIKMGIF